MFQMLVIERLSVSWKSKLHPTLALIPCYSYKGQDTHRTFSFFNQNNWTYWNIDTGMKAFVVCPNLELMKNKNIKGFLPSVEELNIERVRSWGSCRISFFLFPQCILFISCWISFIPCCHLLFWVNINYWEFLKRSTESYLLIWLFDFWSVRI